VFSDAQQQFCTWHAVEVICRKLRELGIPHSDFKPHKDIDGNKIKGIRKHCWEYIESLTPETLDMNREKISAVCKQSGLQFDTITGQRIENACQKYLNKEWKPKEDKTIWLYTRLYANLGATASQRSESYHNVMTEITNAHLTLEDAAQRLATKVTSILKDIETDEAGNHIHDLRKPMFLSLYV
jgi:hypothetical protein